MKKKTLSQQVVELTQQVEALSQQNELLTQRCWELHRNAIHQKVRSVLPDWLQRFLVSDAAAGDLTGNLNIRLTQEDHEATK